MFVRHALGNMVVIVTGGLVHVRTSKQNLLAPLPLHGVSSSGAPTPYTLLTPFFKYIQYHRFFRGDTGIRPEGAVCQQIFFSVEVTNGLTRRLCARSATEKTYNIL